MIIITRIGVDSSSMFFYRLGKRKSISADSCFNINRLLSQLENDDCFIVSTLHQQNGFVIIRKKSSASPVEFFLAFRTIVRVNKERIDVEVYYDSLLKFYVLLLFLLFPYALIYHLYKPLLLLLFIAGVICLRIFSGIEKGMVEKYAGEIRRLFH